MSTTTGARLGAGSVGGVYAVADMPQTVRKELQGRFAELGLALQVPPILREPPPGLLVVRAVEAGGPAGLRLQRIGGQTRALTLRRRQKQLAERRLPAAELLPIAHQLVTALARLHGAGIVHGNLKPHNVFLESAELGWRVTLAEPGLQAFTTSETLRATQRDMVAGYAAHGQAPNRAWLASCRYYAPEVLAGAPFTPAADVYSLGRLLYSVATGADRVGPAPSEVDPQFPAWFDELVAQCLPEDAGRRPQDAEAVLALLPQAQPKAAAGRREPSWAVVAAVATVLVALAGALLLPWPDSAAALRAPGGDEPGTAPQQTAPQQAAPEAPVRPPPPQEAAQHRGAVPGFARGTEHIFAIGVNEYADWPDIREAVPEVNGLLRVLHERYSFTPEHTVSLFNAEASRARIVGQLRRYVRELQPDDSLLLLFAGHGYYNDTTEMGFWVPTDGGRDPLAQHNWISNVELSGYLRRLEARHVLVVADACFAGNLLTTARGRFDHYRRAHRKTSRQVLSSGAVELVRDDSAFGDALTRALRTQPEPVFDALPLYMAVRTAPGEQQPLLGGIAGAGHELGAAYLFFRDP